MEGREREREVWVSEVEAWSRVSDTAMLGMGDLASWSSLEVRML